jgi:hypothetical protein
MNGKGGSSLGTLLFSVPLAAIPLMAIFGIPQFAPLVASPERSGGYDRHSDDRSSDVRIRGGRRQAEEFADELDESEAPEFDADRRPSLDRSLEDRYGRAAAGRARSQRDSAQEVPQTELGEDRQEESPASAFADDLLDRRSTRDRNESPSATEAPAQPAATGLTWQSAAQRFQALGISSYHLEPGSNPTSFLFVCSFCPELHPNVTMRFESESADPLLAVDDVLAQIDRWQQKQSAPQP